MRNVALDSGEMLGQLRQFRDTLKASYGPFGRPALFQPSPGGHVTVTCSSSRLLPMLKTDNVMLKMVVMAIEAHVQQYNDGGLYSALLALNLILSGMDLAVPRHKVAMVTGHALSTVADYLRSEECACRSALDLSSAARMMAVAKTTLSSKAAVCFLSRVELNHLASLLLQGFLGVVPVSVDTAPFSVKERLHVYSTAGRSVSDSKLIPGLLLEATQLLYDRAPDLLCPGREGEGEGEGVAVKRNVAGDIMTAVFSVSMAGDLSEEYPRELQITTTDVVTEGKRSIEDFTVDHMMSTAESLVSEGVGLVGCQKCIHPAVRVYLEGEGVIVADRISSFLIDSVREVTGGELLRSFSLPLPRRWSGKLKNIKRVNVGYKRYLLLEGFGSLHCSLVLCTKSEVVEDELKPLCSTAISVLEHSLSHPYTLHGGGCSETILSHVVELKANEVEDDTLTRLQCNKQIYCRVARSIASSFATMATSLEHHGGLVLTDTTFHHCWSFPPYLHCDPLPSSPQSQTGLNEMGTVERDTGRGGAGIGGGVEGVFAGKTCCCGAVSLNRLPATCTWKCLTRGELSVIPDAINDLIGKREDSSSNVGERFDNAVDERGNDVNDSGIGSVSRKIGSASSSSQLVSEWSQSSPVATPTSKTRSHDCTEQHLDADSVAPLRDCDRETRARSQTTEPGRPDDGLMMAKRCPDVCDPFLAKLAGTELAGDLASSLLNIAYVVTERIT